MKSDFGTLAIVQDDGVVQIVLNRPEARNAISHQMQAEIDVALDAAEIDPEVKAVVLRGEGAIFSAGHDLKEQMGGQSFPALTFPFASPSISPGAAQGVVLQETAHRGRPQLRGALRDRPDRML